MIVLEHVYMEAALCDRVPRESDDLPAQPSLFAIIWRKLAQFGGTLWRGFAWESPGGDEDDVLPPYIVPPII